MILNDSTNRSVKGDEVRMTVETAHPAELRRLVEAYALAMDENDVDAFGEIFVPDGELIVRAAGREKPLAVFRGPGADGVGMIAILMARLYRATLHHITTHYATVQGEEGSGVTYCLAYHMVDEDGESRLETLGVRYEERYVLTEHGWRIRTRDATRLWSQITPTPDEPLLIDRAAAAARRGASS
jgi:hypothetical protein